MNLAIRQFVLSGAAGAIGTAGHYATLLALVEGAGVAPTLATGVGAGAGALINYALSRVYAFQSRRPHREALPRFLLIALVGLGLNVVVMAALLRLPVHYLLAQLVATALVFVFNFIANRSWTFQAPR